MIDVVWDMETNDPDDFITLLFLAGHPQVNLKAVTTFPGTAAQVGLVRHALQEWFQLDIPIGANKLDSPKNAVSDWHYHAYGHIPPSYEAQSADDILQTYCDATTTLITGAPLTNLRSSIQKAQAAQETWEVGHLVIQGGFAGAGVVPPELQMEKFRGLKTCPTYNLMGDSRAAHLLLNYDKIGLRRFVSKNVCHRVIYDWDLHEQITAIKDKSSALAKIWQGMEAYLQKRPTGKMLHDPLAAACAIDSTIGTWANVRLFQEKGEWGAELDSESKTQIIIDYEHEKFMEIFTAY